MKVVVIVDEFSALELAESDPVLHLVERLVLVELVAVGSPHDVRVQVLLRHEELRVADHRVLEEARAIVETVLLVSGQRVLVKADAAVGGAVAPVALVLALGALDRGAEICGPLWLFIVGCSVH